MSVRVAKYADANALKTLIRKAWELTSYGHLEIDPGMLTRSVHEYLTHQRSRVWVAENDGELTGLLAGTVGQMPISRSLAADDAIFYCTSGGIDSKKLIRRYVAWAKKEGAEVVGMCVSSGNASADRLIEASGFTRAGGNYYLTGGDNE